MSLMGFQRYIFFFFKGDIMKRSPWRKWHQLYSGFSQTDDEGIRGKGGALFSFAILQLFPLSCLRIAERATLPSLPLKVLCHPVKVMALYQNRDMLFSGITQCVLFISHCHVS